LGEIWSLNKEKSRILSKLRISSCFSLEQRKAIKKNLHVLFFEEKHEKNFGFKLFAKNSALRSANMLIRLWELNSFRLRAELKQ